MAVGIKRGSGGSCTEIGPTAQNGQPDPKLPSYLYTKPENMRSFKKLDLPTRRHLYFRAVSLQRRRGQRRHASAAAGVAPAAPIDHAIHPVTPIARYPPTQPPSYKPPEFRKSQLLRSYASLIQSSPLILLFQHNNIRSIEWMALRREMAIALRKLDESHAKGKGSETDTTISSGIKLQILQTGIFATALRIVEFYNPVGSQQHYHSVSPASTHPTDPHLQSSTFLSNTTSSPTDAAHRHLLSHAVHDSIAQTRQHHGLEPLLSGPLAALSFPTLSSAHLSALLRILSPSPAFPAPKRREQPSYHDPAVAAAVSKLLLLGARAEGRALDGGGVAWVGSIEGGLDGLRGQLVGLLQGMGLGVARVLEGAGTAMYAVVEGRRRMLEEEQKEGDA